MTNITKTLLMPSKRKSYIGFRLAYIHLTLAHSKVQGQSQFDCEIFKEKLTHAAFRHMSESTLPFLVIIAIEWHQCDQNVEILNCQGKNVEILIPRKRS